MSRTNRVFFNTSRSYFQYVLNFLAVARTFRGQFRARTSKFSLRSDRHSVSIRKKSATRRDPAAEEQAPCAEADRGHRGGLGDNDGEVAVVVDHGPNRSSHRVDAVGAEVEICEWSVRFGDKRARSSDLASTAERRSWRCGCEMRKWRDVLHVAPFPSTYRAEPVPAFSAFRLASCHSCLSPPTASATRGDVLRERSRSGPTLHSGRL